MYYSKFSQKYHFLLCVATQLKTKWRGFGPLRSQLQGLKESKDVFRNLSLQFKTQLSNENISARNNNVKTDSSVKRFNLFFNFISQIIYSG